MTTGKRIRTYFTAAMVMVGVVLIGQQAKAETVMPTVELDRSSLFFQFLESKSFGAGGARQLAAYERAFGVSCGENYRVTLQQVRVIRPVVTVPEGPLFVAEGVPQPTGGLWFNRHSINRCGEDVTYNSMVRILDNGTLLIQHLVLGQTGLTPLLINGFKQRAARMAQIEGCSEVVVRDTMNGVPDGYERQNEDAVYETWTIWGCEQSVRLVVRLEGNDQGGIQMTAENRTVLN